MKICWVIDETPFYHPDMLATFIRQSSDQVVGVVRVTHIPPKHNIELYMRRNFYKLQLPEIIRLMFRKIKYQLFDFFIPVSIHSNRFYSVRKVCKAFAIPFVTAYGSLNNAAILQFLKEINPDIVISSNSLIFSKQLLAIPRLACINRHSALLPSYGGLWPVFQALAHGENQVGVSVHIMLPQIDKGPILSQQAISVLPTDTVDSLYAQCFSISPALILQAIDTIREGSPNGLHLSHKPSYFSFPTCSDWSSFRKNKRRFV